MKKYKSLKTKICPICNKEFTTTYNSVKYCSEACIKENKRMYQRRYIMKPIFQKKPKPKPAALSDGLSVKDIMRIIKDHYETTGIYLSYGKAVEAIDSGIIKP